MERLRHEPFESLEFATLDLHRAVRRGFPETVYGPGKTADQIVTIVGRIRSAGQTAFVTRVGPEIHEAVAAEHPRAEYHEAARAVVVKDVESWQMVGGNPARVIGRRELRKDG